MNRNTVKAMMPIGNPHNDGVLYDPVTALIAVASAVGAKTSYDAAKDQKKAMKKQQAEAKKAQEEADKSAVAEKKKADMEAQKQQRRLLKGRSRGGLLFGSEHGTGDDSMKQTLG